MFEKNVSPRFVLRTIGIILVGFLSMYFSCCLGADCLNVIQPAFQEKFGWSFTSITMPGTIASYVVIFGAFVYSTIIMKNGTRIFATVSFIILAVSTLMIGISYNSEGNMAFWMLVAGQFLTRMFVQAVQLCFFQVCANWFVKTRGRIMGVTMAACALDNATATAIMTKASSAIGFGNTYYIIAALLIVIAVMAFIFFRTTPQEVGLTPDGCTEETPAVNEEKYTEYKTKWTLKKLLKCRESWIIMFAFGVFNMTITCVIAEYVIRMTELNIDLEKAFGMLAIAGVAGIFASPVYGVLVDKFGAPKATALLGLFDTLMMVGFRFGSPDRMAFIYMGVAGIALFSGTPTLHPGLTIHVFGAKEYQAANRYLSIVINLIAAGAVTFMSLIKDMTGTLNLAYTIMAVLDAVAMVLVFTIKKTYAEE